MKAIFSPLSTSDPDDLIARDDDHNDDEEEEDVVNIWTRLVLMLTIVLAFASLPLAIVTFKNTRWGVPSWFDDRLLTWVRRSNLLWIVINYRSTFMHVNHFLHCCSASVFVILHVYVYYVQLMFFLWSLRSFKDKWIHYITMFFRLIEWRFDTSLFL